MRCWYCNTELIWGGDHDLAEEYIMVTNLSCPNCGSYVEVFLPKKKELNLKVIKGEKE